jgi:LmbE family N-acetylglucosaminyl deacetylase
VNVVVVAAHPDDEVLGCGGTVARYAAEGHAVTSVIVATGSTSRDGSPPGYVDALRDHAHAAARALGARPPRFLGLPDNRLDTLPLLDVVKLVEAVLDELRPEIVLTHFDGDLNIDHGVVGRAVLTAARPLPGSPVRAIYAFETPSSTEWQFSPTTTGFRPNRYVLLSEEQVERKLAALASYAGEMREPPHPRSLVAVRAMATVRGSEAGASAAEAFMVLRETVP